jgi:hypothetical protein
MPKFKDVEFVAKNDAGAVDKFKVSVEISATGAFYAHVPNKLKVSFPERKIDNRRRCREGFFKTVGMETFKELEDAVKKAHEAFMEPTVTKDPVIRYNIESHVSFATDKEGRIFPNARYPGAEWRDGIGDKTYGGHCASHRSKGGFSLTVGAEASLKVTTTWGDQSEVTYESYYGEGGDHHGHDNPAERLNSWVSFSLPEDAKEMPYSDEAALFFHGLMMAMAELNRRIQDFTKTPDRLALTIAKHKSVLMLPGPESKS